MAALPTELPWIDGSLRLPPLYLFASWLAMSMTVLLVAGYVWRLADDARRHALALSATQLALAREQELSALGGQAAAAAHLLGTPLATINVIAKELVRELPPDSPLKEDADELLAQAQRCRETLASLGSGRRDARIRPSPRHRSRASEHHRRGLPQWCHRIDVTVDVAPGLREPRVSLAPELRHAIANLVDNAVRFATRHVEIAVAVDPAGRRRRDRRRRPGLHARGAGLARRALPLDPPQGRRARARRLYCQDAPCPNGCHGAFCQPRQVVSPEKGALVRIGWPSGALEQLGREPTRDD
jgi:signal transduction histidine kinase